MDEGDLVDSPRAPRSHARCQGGYTADLRRLMRNLLDATTPCVQSPPLKCAGETGMQRTSVRQTSQLSIVPMIYVASLADYVAGRLVGRWFDLSEHGDADDLLAHIADWLEDLEQRDGVKREEWAIHDSENVGHIGPCPANALLDEYIEAIHDGVDLDALEKYVDAGGYPSDFRGRYVGTFDSPSDFGAALLEVSGTLDLVPPRLRPYLDHERYAHDALLGNYFEVDGFYFLR